MLHVTDAKYIGDYKISVEFNDGCRFVADFEGADCWASSAAMIALL